MEKLIEKNNINSKVIGTKLIFWRNLKFIQNEKFKELSSEAKHKLKTSLVSNNFTQPFYVWENKEGLHCLDGKHRFLLLEELITEGIKIPLELPATFIECTNKKEAAKLVLLFSSQYAKVTNQGMFDFLTLNDLNFEELKNEIDIPNLENYLSDTIDEEVVKNAFKSLTEKFLVPPFSVLDTRQGYWQDRKRNWQNIGIKSQETREDIELISKSGQGTGAYKLKNKMRIELNREPTWDEIIDRMRDLGMHIYEGASIFDPVLTEVLYTWFCKEKSSIIDPFAGGSVRGIVAAHLGHEYHGIDLRLVQVEANIKQAKEIGISGCFWYEGNSVNINQIMDKNIMADFIFSCPPYHDLEKYSDNPEDLSNLDYETFIIEYRKIIVASMQKLKQDRFACFVVADIRNEKGFYKNFVSQTIECFNACKDELENNVELYNEIILVNVAGSLPMRISRQFNNGRKVGKMHQNVLVFYKGDPKKIKQNFPEIELSNDFMINQ